MPIDDGRWWVLPHLPEYLLTLTRTRSFTQKCDGQRPVCGQCERAGKPEDCGYVDSQTRSRTQILEENIAQLEARIEELENPELSQALVKLHDPLGKAYEAHHRSSSSISYVPSSHSDSGPSGTTSPTGGTRSPSHPLSARDIEDISAQHAQRMLDHFFQHASLLGWFLNVTRFQHALSLPARNSNRPVPALVNAVYLWGTAILRQVTEGNPPVDESVFLRLALSEVEHGLGPSPSHQVVQFIQARVLLAAYYYLVGKAFEGRHQSDAAASLVLISGFHKIRSAQLSPTFPSYVDPIPLTLGAPRDQVEEGERINAFWTVFALDRTWAVVFGAPTVMSDSEAFGTQIDTPWPLDMETYERGWIYPNFRSGCTLRNYLEGINTGWPWETHALLAQYGKVAALFERATNVAAGWRPGMVSTYAHARTSNTLFHSPQAEIPSPNIFYSNFVSIDKRIDEFKAQMYVLENTEGMSSEIVRNVHLIQCLASAATIQLHAAFAQQNALSRNKCFTAAQEIVQANATARAHEFLVVNPMIGIVGAAAARVFIREIVTMRSEPVEHSSTPSEREMQARSGLEQLQAMMAIFAPVSALINYHFGRLQQERIGL
ncbi:hypothetical protein EVG20_g4864 [Dentipellis fragilis]|uniref:Xylanolytic transcriptional activator regulatory domain-containing protein n=1 Tax=Dentipellis fragilis TaxID=205917 RepID=A0A4Y9YWY4_9AGAM|nr:hypothetical protein EVG20_g4864 [Dentipellis fragilis]